MLGIQSIAADRESYYVDAVARGVDEYYRGIGEAPGWWAGTTAYDELGLTGEVGSDDLRTVWNGGDPRSGIKLAPFTNRKVGGFDLCWRAPKSVSLLYAFGSPSESRAVRDAHDAAVAAAFRYMETNAAGTRTGHGGLQTEPVDGLVAAMFRHRTSRTGDPHLHTHVLVANIVRCGDGTWRTLDGRLLFRHAKTAGYLYQAHLRYHLTVRLGVEWQPVVKGTADVVGIDRDVIMAFSERRRQILEHLDTTGFRTARAAQIATLATRPDKANPGELTMRKAWHDKARNVGFNPISLLDVTDRVRPYRKMTREGPGLLDHLAGPDGVTKMTSTFTRLGVLRAIAERLPDGGTVDRVEALADTFLDRTDVVPLVERADWTHAVEYSTTELLALEERLVTGALDRQREGAGITTGLAVTSALVARPTMGNEQVAIVEQLCLAGDGVAVVSAAAGTGKTFALAAAHDAWRRDGYRVLGAAVAAKAARGLDTATGIPSVTLTRLNNDITNGRLRPDARTIFVIDEAGMAGTRQLAPILDAAQSTGAKVVLTGDPHQLPEIEAGGMLGTLTRLLDAATLTENRRQVDAWERAALDELRTGDVDHALDAFAAHGRLVTGDDAYQVRQQMADDWWTARTQGDHVAMIAIRRSDVDDLNGRARRHLQANGHLTGPVLDIDDRPYQAGDEIICLRNDYRLGVRNGDRATIEHVDPTQRTMRARFDDQVRTLPTDYLDAGHVAHAYATTIHKAQGITVDRCLILGTDDLYRQAGYVALSRGRTNNTLYAIGHRGIDDDFTHAPQRDPDDPVQAVRDALGREGSKNLAIEQASPDDDWATDLAERKRCTVGIGNLEGFAHSRDDDNGIGIGLCR